MGLSAKARYYANQAKKGKITKTQASSAMAGRGLSVPKVKTASGANQATVPNNFIGPLAPNQSRDTGTVLDKYGQGYSVAPALQSSFLNQVNNAPTESKSSKKSTPKKVNTTQRESARNGQDALGGESFINASKSANNNRRFSIGPSNSNGPSTTTSPWRNYLDKGLDIAKYAAGPLGILGQGLNNYGFDLTNLLDIPTAEASIYDRENLGMNSNLAEEAWNYRTDQAKQNINDVTGTNVFTTDNPTNSRNTTPVQDNPTNSGGNNINNSPTNNPTNNRQSSPVSKPTPTQILPAIVKALIEYGQPQQDNTSIQNNPGTVRRPVGMGEMSNGWASNGAGGYNFGGGGNIMGADQNALGDSLGNDWRSILGIDTAQAAEIPNQSFQTTDMPESSFAMPSWVNPQTYQPNMGQMSSMNSITPDAMAINGLTAPVKDKYKDTPPVSNPQNPGGSANGGLAQKYDQGKTGGSKGGFDTTYYDKSMKAQKKAADELIKSIKNEYSNSQTEGTTALEKAKQEDLLKLSGLFSFGLNQDPNSGQQMQYTQRTQADYAGKLTDFLNKLAQGQSKDISSAKTNYQSSLADIMAQMQKSKDDYENQQWDRNYKMAALKQKGGNQGFTPAQQQAYLSSYSKDLQSTLGKYSKLGYGQNGREQAANELAQRWGNIFEPESIAQDVSQNAPNGWEGQYRQMYGNNMMLQALY